MGKLLIILASVLVLLAIMHNFGLDYAVLIVYRNGIGMLIIQQLNVLEIALSFPTYSLTI